MKAALYNWEVQNHRANNPMQSGKLNTSLRARINHAKEGRNNRMDAKLNESKSDEIKTRMKIKLASTIQSEEKNYIA